jgi:hypothetical protein
VRGLSCRHFLHGLERSAVGEAGGNAGGAERVTADFRRMSAAEARRRIIRQMSCDRVSRSGAKKLYAFMTRNAVNTWNTSRSHRTGDIRGRGVLLRVGLASAGPDAIDDIIHLWNGVPVPICLQQ